MILYTLSYIFYTRYTCNAICPLCWWKSNPRCLFQIDASQHITTEWTHQFGHIRFCEINYFDRSWVPRSRFFLFNISFIRVVVSNISFIFTRIRRNDPLSLYSNVFQTTNQIFFLWIEILRSPFFFVKFWRLPEAKGVHQPLPHTGQPPAVHSLQLDKVAKRASNSKN